jgi:2-dehydropantoate 2-reductase
MNILIYGAGPLGTLFAGRLIDGGHSVSILARGTRLEELRQHGLVLVDTQTGWKEEIPIAVVEQLSPDDVYDMVIVIMRKNRALEILPALAANQHIPTVLFLMNNAAGPGELVDALGRERVMVGFPSAGGYRRGHVVHYLAGSNTGEPSIIPIGEVDGRITARTGQVAQVISSMPGFAPEVRTDMDAWLKTHVALLMPSIAPALSAAAGDHVRLANTRDLVVLTVRAVREGFKVLRALDIPITPARLRIFDWLPEPLLVSFLQKKLADERIRTALVEHAQAAGDEIMHLAGEFDRLTQQAGIPTPAIDRLSAYFDPETPRVPEGQAQIPLDWRAVWAAVLVTAGFVGGLWILVRKRAGRQD